MVKKSNKIINKLKKKLTNTTKLTNVKNIYNNVIIIFILVFITIVIQAIITYNFTNTKKLSLRAFIRNFSFVICIYYFIKTNIIALLFIPFIIEIIIEFAKYKGFHIEKYIATEYQYNDYWREINKHDIIFSNFSEGNYDKILGFNTLDHSQENLKRILDWSKKTYDDSLKNKTPYLLDYNNKKHYAPEIKNITDQNKFKLICEICKIKPGMKILEIGFGEGDFINYIKNEYNIDVVGVSIAHEQVKLIESRGFKGHTMNSWDMTPEVLGTFDLILQCGNLEYILLTGESYEKYAEYSRIINRLLNKNGKYFITCIHFNQQFKNSSFYDKLRCYFLWSGNDGRYPSGKDGFTKYAQKAGLTPIFQQDRTNDYFITTVIFMSYLQCMKNNKCVNSVSFSGLLEALFKTIAGPYYLHTYLCYSPTSDFNWLPWQWEFIAQYKDGILESPTTLEYILFEKQ